MKEIKLSLGDRLAIELYNSNGERVSPHLTSLYERSLPDGSMEILAPIKGGRLLPIHQGVELGVIYEKSGELYKFIGEVIERRASGNIYLLRIMPKSGAEHLQRRSFYRFDHILDIKYRLFEEKDITNVDRGEYKKAITRDISGGGISVLVNEKPVYGWYMEGIIDIGSGVQFIGKVVRTNKVQDEAKFRYEVGIEFTDISDLEREKVISFIFDSQRKMLKKGWLTR